jgi:hypothetical protein
LVAKHGRCPDEAEAAQVPALGLPVPGLAGERERLFKAIDGLSMLA